MNPNDYIAECRNQECGHEGLASAFGGEPADPKCPQCGSPTEPADIEGVVK